MPDLFPLKPTHKPVKDYFAALATFQRHGHTTEGNTRSAFADLLKRCCGPFGWHLVEEYQLKGTAKQSLRADGALVDDLTLVHGLWEAKDTADDLQKEIKSKVAKGYPLTNILFQSPTHAVLYQDNRIALDTSIAEPEKLLEILQLFFEHRQAHEVDWETAVTKFAEKIPDLAQGVTQILEDEHKRNSNFRERFAAFAELCRQSINPDLSDESVRKMLVQHLLTARIFTRVFNNEEFLRRNVIAAEIEKVIDSITSRYFSRSEFLKPLDHFYTAIEKAAESQTGYTEKQHFLNAVYEKFFQRFDTKQADTHGIVYTPQPIVDFMVRSVDEILQQEFGKSLSDSGVHILDPFTGTGNFITRIIQQIRRSALPQKYAEELHCNEIMLLPYYIASMNIEHAYMERTRGYLPFEGICLADTFDLAEEEQSSLFTAENTERVKRQRAREITVVIGNPPYNVGQKSENDDNQNRSYKALNKSIKASYGSSSEASSVAKLDNPYVKAIRWASDRIGKHGVVAYITESGFLHQHAFDGMRQHLSRDFDSLYILDLAGDVSTSPQYSGSAHNVFGIKLGVSITFFVRKKERTTKHATLNYLALPPEWKKGQRLSFLEDHESIAEIKFQKLKPGKRNTWLTEGLLDSFATHIALASKAGRAELSTNGIFSVMSLGTNSNRDAWAYGFNRAELERKAHAMLDTYAYEAYRWAHRDRSKSLSFEKFVDRDEKRIKWSSTLLQAAKRNAAIERHAGNIRPSIYRPFTRKWQYFAPLFTHRRSKQGQFFPNASSENKVLIVSTYGRSAFAAFVSNSMPDINFFVEPAQTFAFYTYADSNNRRDNVSDSALEQFRTHYTDDTITKWDIFHATYAVLHHPEYRTRYAANLKRELPRIPFPPDLHAFAAAGRRLMELHIDYEQQPEYSLEHIEHPTNPVSFRVERMKLSKDKTSLTYNDFLTLRGIPPAAFSYRLGNRSALEWIIDQYRVSTDPRSGITNDPNRDDDPQYILRLIGQVITVSLETQAIIAALPSLNLGDPTPKS